jgi:hypothetical protein
MDTMLAADLAGREPWLAAPLPWAANPFRLVSLWDMLYFNATAFIRLAKSLAYIDAVADISQPELATIAENHQRLTRELEKSRGITNKQARKFVEEKDYHWGKIRSKIEAALTATETACKDLPLTSALAQVRRVRDYLDGGYPMLDRAFASMRAIGERIEDEMGSFLFMWVPASK